MKFITLLPALLLAGAAHAQNTMPGNMGEHKMPGGHMMNQAASAAPGPDLRQTITLSSEEQALVLAEMRDRGEKV